MADEVRIRLRGYADAEVISAIFASDLVDILYVDEVTPEGIFLIPDTGFDFANPSDFEQAEHLIRHVLRNTNNENLIIEDGQF